MKDKIYPAFYRSTDGYDYLYLDATNYYDFSNAEWSEADDIDTVDHENDINITHEYLANTYGEVASPEHAEFIIELARANDIEVCKSFRGGLFFNFYRRKDSGKLVLFFFSEDKAKEEGEKRITIPLPPKAKPKIYPQESIGEAPKHFDCVCNKCGGKCCTGQCDKQESSEWPQINDEVSLRYKFDSKQIMHTGKLLYLSDNHIIIATDKKSDYHVHRCDWSIEKPKTPEEELRDELKFDIDLLLSAYEKPSIITEKLLEKYDIKKKPQ